METMQKNGDMNSKRRVMLVLIAWVKHLKSEGIKTLVPDRLIEFFTMLAEHPTPEMKLLNPARRRFFAQVTTVELKELLEEYHRTNNAVLLMQAEVTLSERTATPQRGNSEASRGTLEGDPD